MSTFPSARDTKKQTDAISIPTYTSRINQLINQAVSNGQYETQIERIPVHVSTHCVELLNAADFNCMETNCDGTTCLLTISWDDANDDE